MQPRSILVIRGGAIGDFILTLPVFAALRQAFPLAALHILGRPSIAQLALAGGLADAINDLDSACLAGLFVPEGRVEQPWIDYFASFDLVISFIHDPNGVFRGHIRQLTPALYIQGIHRPSETQNLHATDALLASLKSLFLFVSSPLPQLRLSNPKPPFSPPVIALHPGSGSKMKNWPLPQWVKLTQALLANTAHDLLVIGGESDSEECARLIDQCPSSRIRTVLHEPLVSVADSLRRCRLYIGHDTGITHLAAALGIPTLVLWGPTRKQVWAPPQSQVMLLEDAGGLACLESSRVVRTVLDVLNKSLSLEHLGGSSINENNLIPSGISKRL